MVLAPPHGSNDSNRRRSGRVVLFAGFALLLWLGLASERVYVGVVAYSGVGWAERDGGRYFFGKYRLDRISEDADGFHAGSQRRDCDAVRAWRARVAEVNLEAEFDSCRCDGAVHGNAHANIDCLVADDASGGRRGQVLHAVVFAGWVAGNLNHDSKAIVGVARRYQFPSLGPLRSGDFSGGLATVKRKLDQLGFEVRVPDATGAASSYWWHGSQADRFWAEIRRVREGLGQELRCPFEDAVGHRNGWWDLVDDLRTGDCVYHWNAEQGR